jgi:hypothetical protein
METPTSSGAEAVQPYLDAAFGRPTSHDDGSLLVWSPRAATATG